MATNVEIKARVRDWDALVRAVEALSDTPGEVLHQKDTFFSVPRGRLKLRVPSPGGGGQLISYDRDDAAGPTPSRYVIAPVADPGPVKAALAAALGVRGVIRKTRHLYRAGRTRIHLDNVVTLGRFIELEVVLTDAHSPEDGVARARDLMNRLDIRDADLVNEAYIDLCERCSNAPQGASSERAHDEHGMLG